MCPTPTTRLHLVGRHTFEVNGTPVELIEKFLGRESKEVELCQVDGRTVAIVPNDIVHLERLR